jgi:hypothetical protein
MGEARKTWRKGPAREKPSSGLMRKSSGCCGFGRNEGAAPLPMHYWHTFSLVGIIRNVLNSRKYSMNAPASLVAFPISIWPSAKTA